MLRSQQGPTRSGGRRQPGGRARPHPRGAPGASGARSDLVGRHLAARRRAVGRRGADNRGAGRSGGGVDLVVRGRAAGDLAGAPGTPRPSGAGARLALGPPRHARARRGHARLDHRPGIGRPSHPCASCPCAGHPCAGRTGVRTVDGVAARRPRAAGAAHGGRREPRPGARVPSRPDQRARGAGRLAVVARGGPPPPTAPPAAVDRLWRTLVRGEPRRRRPRPRPADARPAPADPTRTDRVTIHPNARHRRATGGPTDDHTYAGKDRAHCDDGPAPAAGTAGPRDQLADHLRCPGVTGDAGPRPGPANEVPDPPPHLVAVANGPPRRRDGRGRRAGDAGPRRAVHPGAGRGGRR